METFRKCIPLVGCVSRRYQEGGGGSTGIKQTLPRLYSASVGCELLQELFLSQPRCPHLSKVIIITPALSTACGYCKSEMRECLEKYYVRGEILSQELTHVTRE